MSPNYKDDRTVTLQGIAVLHMTPKAYQVRVGETVHWIAKSQIKAYTLGSGQMVITRWIADKIGITPESSPETSAPTHLPSRIFRLLTASLRGKPAPEVQETLYIGQAPVTKVGSMWKADLPGSVSIVAPDWDTLEALVTACGSAFPRSKNERVLYPYVTVEGMVKVCSRHKTEEAALKARKGHCEVYRIKSGAQLEVGHIVSSVYSKKHTKRLDK